MKTAVSNLSSIKTEITTGLVCLGVLLIPASSLAVNVSDVPNPRQAYGGWVTDMANILQPETEQQLNQLINQLEQTNGSEIAVVTVPDTQPSASPKDFATELFNTWQIGKAEADNGVLFLISHGERRVEIETGYGVEAILPDAKVGNIIDTQVLPNFKQGNFDRGVLAGTQAIVVAIETPPSAAGDPVAGLPQSPAGDPVSEPGPAQPFSWLLWIVGGGAALTGALGVRTLRRSTKLEPTGSSRWRWANPFSQLRCAQCQAPLERIPAKEVQKHLTKAQRVAKNIGSTSFQGYRCPQCQPQLTGQGVHIVGQRRWWTAYRLCPNCNTWTVQRTNKVLRSATTYSSGKRLITDKCLVCDYHHEDEEIIPRIVQSTHTHGGGGGFSGGGGGGSFGGGSSGGGGAGGSW